METKLITWDPAAQDVAADPAATLALSRGQWEALGAHFEPTEDVLGGTARIATGVVQANEPVRFAVLDHDAETTFLLVEGSYLEHDEQVTVVLQALVAEHLVAADQILERLPAGDERGENPLVAELWDQFADLQRKVAVLETHVAAGTAEAKSPERRGGLLARIERNRSRSGRGAGFKWYVVNTYSGQETKVKQNLERRVTSLGQKHYVRQVVVPTGPVSEMKKYSKISVEKRTMPGYVLINMEANDDSWGLVKNTPGVTGFVGGANEPVPLTQTEVDRLLRRGVAEAVATSAPLSIGEQVRVISGPLSDFSGEITEINHDAEKLKILVSVFGRETLVEVALDQVRAMR
jgi:transcriptional antiterminator NusG